MEALPAEILEEIVGYLFGSDLNSLRLVNRTLSAAANIFKFRALHVRLTRSELDNLLNISRQPALACCVREITYPHALLAPMKEPFLDDQDWYRERSFFSDYKSFTKMFFKWYNDHYKAQTEIAKSGESIQTLETALSRMANIRTIIPGQFNHNARCELFGKWYRTLTETLMTFVPRDPSEIYALIMDCDVLEYEALEAAMKSFMDLVNTLNRLEFKLDRFGSRGAELWCGFYSQGSGLWNCASLFQNLTSVSVCITTVDALEDTTALKKDAMEARILKFLSFAPNLRMLSLEMVSFPRKHEFKDPGIRLLDILGRSYVWKHLHSFCLDFHPIHLGDLTEFLERHARTLKRLRFGFALLHATWRELLDFLKERLHLMGLKLDHPFEICEHGGNKYFDFNANRRMEDYVLHGGAPFPPTQMELAG
ncbi:hypothetical protein RUND412_002016 [Rhizina undulata]